MINKTLIVMTAIICVTGLTALAVYKGINGAIFMSSLAIIGGLAGYELKVLKDKIKPI